MEKPLQNYIGLAYVVVMDHIGQTTEPKSYATLRKMLSGNRLVPRSSLVQAGTNPASLARAVENGIAAVYARGIYMAGDAELSEGANFAATSLLNPGGVVCLSSAALYHRFSNENPGVVWYAVDPNRTKQIRGAARDPVKLVFWSADARSVGVDVLEIAGVTIKITNPARTVVDMLRYRNKLGDDPAMKTLRDFAAEGGDLNEVIRIADKLGWRKSVEVAVRAAEELQPLIGRPMSP